VLIQLDFMIGVNRTGEKFLFVINKRSLWKVNSDDFIVVFDFKGQLVRNIDYEGVTKPLPSTTPPIDVYRVQIRRNIQRQGAKYG
jgi:hypothetical protein